MQAITMLVSIVVTLILVDIIYNCKIEKLRKGYAEECSYIKQRLRKTMQTLALSVNREIHFYEIIDDTVYQVHNSKEPVRVEEIKALMDYLELEFVVNPEQIVFKKVKNDKK